MAKTRHVVPSKNGGWDSKKGGAERASKHFEKKKKLRPIAESFQEVKVQSFSSTERTAGSSAKIPTARTLIHPGDKIN